MQPCVHTVCKSVIRDFYSQNHVHERKHPKAMLSSRSIQITLIFYSTRNTRFGETIRGIVQFIRRSVVEFNPFDFNLEPLFHLRRIRLFTQSHYSSSINNRYDTDTELNTMHKVTPLPDTTRAKCHIAIAQTVDSDVFIYTDVIAHSAFEMAVG